MILAERAARIGAEALAARAAAFKSGTEVLLDRLKLEIEKRRRELYSSRPERKARLLEQLTAARGSGSRRHGGRTGCRAGVAATLIKPFEGRRPSRKPFSEHLLRERIVVAAPESCPYCG